MSEYDRREHQGLLRPAMAQGTQQGADSDDLIGQAGNYAMQKILEATRGISAILPEIDPASLTLCMGGEDGLTGPTNVAPADVTMRYPSDDGGIGPQPDVTPGDVTMRYPSDDGGIGPQPDVTPGDVTMRYPSDDGGIGPQPDVTPGDVTMRYPSDDGGM